MKSLLGPEFSQFADSLRQAPPVSIRYNPLKNVRQQGTSVPWCSSGRYLQSRPVFTLDPLFHAGSYYVQEASSMFLEQAVKQVVKLTDPIVALDLCASPGGKTTHLAGLLQQDSMLVSNETIRGRLPALIENVEKAGFANIAITNNDPADFSELKAFFDLVVIDAPCSGEGLFRKEPEAMKHWSRHQVQLCSLRQQRILRSAWDAINSGGILIYSTCTFNEDENIENLQRFAGDHDVSFLKLRVDPGWGVKIVERQSAVGYQFYPHKTTGEGFFLSVLKKGSIQEVRRRHEKSKDLHDKVSSETWKACQDWLTGIDRLRPFTHGEEVRVLPEWCYEKFTYVASRLRVVRSGTAMASHGKSKIVPLHPLAWSIHLNKAAFQRINLDQERAISFLRKDPLAIAEGKPGFGLAEFENLGLGWVNILPTRVNNLYPSELRIRMRS